ncbi:MAG: hypothetical protein HZA17_08460 [Nitrospirae bacterium]|nr:hypothetical protein [Nitrospirota bacterium]
MKKALLTKFDRLMAAVTFAEEGEFETAREIMREGERFNKRNTDRPEVRKTQTLRKSH